MGVVVVPILIALQLASRDRPASATTINFSTGLARVAYPDFSMVGEDRSDRQLDVQKRLGEALTKYPEGTLKTVFVVKTLEYRDAPFGGTASADGRSIILAIGDRSGSNTDWIGHALHHEVAHSLMFRMSGAFPRDAWLAQNAPGFKYAHDSGLAALKSGDTDFHFVPALAEQGVLSAYGSSSFDEDWACYAQYLLTDDPDFWKLVRRYPRVRAKAKLAVEFYRKAVPGMALPDVD